MMIMIFENRRRSASVKYSILLLTKDIGLDDLWAWIGTILILLNKENWKLVRGESHIYFRTQCVIMMFGGGGGWLSLMTFWNSEQLPNFKVHKLPWIVNELCTYLIIDEKILSNIYKISKKLAKLSSYQNPPACILRVAHMVHFIFL